MALSSQLVYTSKAALLSLTALSGHGAALAGKYGSASWWDTLTSPTGVAPSMAVDFNADKYMDNGVEKTYAELITHTRASTGNYFNSAGLLVTAPIDGRRREFRNGSHRILVELAATNRLLWCRDFSNAAWVKTNMTATKDETGLDGEANEGSSLTADANNATCIQTAATVGNNVFSVFIKRLSGIGTIEIKADATTWVDVTAIVDGASAFIRVETPWAAITSTDSGIRLGTSGDKIAVDYAQTETVTAGLTSPILTTTVAATRARDFYRLSGSPFVGFDAVKGTLVVTVERLYDGSKKYSMKFALSNGSGTDIIFEQKKADDLASFFGKSGNVNVFFLGNLPSADFALGKHAVSIELNNFAVSIDGSSPLTDTSGAMPVGIDRLALGVNGYSTTDDGIYHIKSAAFYPDTHAGADLQGLSS